MVCFGGCATPSGHSSATTSTAPVDATTQTAAADTGVKNKTLWVPPPVGSLLGGGYVRVANEVQGNDEAALIGTIGQLNAAGGSKEERPFVISAVSRSTGVSVRELRAQQDNLRLQFGQLCAINAIAHGNSNKVQEIALLKSKGKTWTELAQANGISIATVVQKARNANEMTVNSFTNNAERAKGGQDKLKLIGVKVQKRPGD